MLIIISLTVLKARNLEKHELINFLSTNTNLPRAIIILNIDKQRVSSVLSWLLWFYYCVAHPKSYLAVFNISVAHSSKRL